MGKRTKKVEVSLRSVLVAWGLLAVVFLLALFGLLRASGGGEESKKEESEYSEPGVSDSAVMIRVKLDSEVHEMNLDDYVQGVLRAEMPASFELEALKAQAVAARTETMYKAENGPVANHPEADICNDIGCCQAYKSVESAAEIWGGNAGQYSEKITAAVRSTDGQVILYGDKPILAAFFSAAGGRTNGSGDVWVSDLPYLQSVESPEGADQVPNYYSTVTIPQEEFRRKFLSAYPKADLSGSAGGWFGAVERNASDMVRTIRIGGVEVKGTKVRSLFGLRSACFTVTAEGSDVVFQVTGYGHGVGMSQYGANVMASEGKTYREILEWYYTGVTVAPYTPKKLQVSQ